MKCSIGKLTLRGSGIYKRWMPATYSAFFLLVIVSFGAQAEANKKTAEFEGISVSGSNELPQVLYIVPWQPPAYQKRAQHPPNAKLSGMLKPIEPAFHNEDYHFRKKLEVKVQALNGRK